MTTAARLTIVLPGQKILTYSKATVKKCDFNLPLKVSRFYIFLKFIGKWFHSLSIQIAIVFFTMPGVDVLSGNKIRDFNFCNFFQVRRTIILQLFGSQEGVHRF